jgi:hypothetical protein
VIVGFSGFDFYGGSLVVLPKLEVNDFTVDFLFDPDFVTLASVILG